MKSFNYINILTAFIFTVSLNFYQTSFGQAKPRGNISAITGQKFKMRQKKSNGRKQINYINSIKLIGGIGSTAYFGDLCSGMDCLTPRPNMVFGIEYRLDESITVRSEINWVRLSGSDKGGVWESRNLSFKSNNFEFSAAVLYDIFEYNKMYRRRHLFSPYVFLGVGLTTNNPTAELNGERHSLRPLQTEGVSYSGVSFVVPYGAGVKIKVSPVLNLALEAGYRWAFTDYLDDVSGEYGDFSGENGSVAQLLSDRRPEYVTENPTEKLYNLPQRGGADSNDGYFMFQIKGEYTLKVTKQHYNINSNVNRMRIIKSIKKKP